MSGVPLLAALMALLNMVLLPFYLLAIFVYAPAFAVILLLVMALPPCFAFWTYTSCVRGDRDWDSFVTVAALVGILYGLLWVAVAIAWGTEAPRFGSAIPYL
jgi:hypothetical protein